MKDLALHKQIKEKLIQNQKVVLTNVDEHIHLPNIKKYPHYEAGFAHLIYFYIAPKEKMHREDLLNPFMNSLFPSLTPSLRQNFKEELDEYLHYGQLEFKEIIGREERGEKKITIFDNEFKNKFGFTNGEVMFPKEKEDLIRKVIIKIYPDKDISYFVAKNYEIGHSLKDDSHRQLRWKIEEYMKPEETDLRYSVCINSLQTYCKNRSEYGFKEQKNNLETIHQ